jgi:hypothetical protein
MKRLALGAVALAVLMSQPALAQCVMCKTALVNSGEGQRIAAEFNRAILLMVVAPYVVFLGIAAVVFRTRIQEWLRARLSSPEPSPSRRA